MVPTRQIVPHAVSEMLRRQPHSPAKVRFAWHSSVGAAIARTTAIELDGSRTLRVVAETDHWRREVERAAPVITKRLIALLGADVVRRISVRHR